MKKVEVDKDLCIGCGACFINYSDLFEQDDEDGLAVAIKNEVDGQDEENASKASEDCPVGAISVNYK